MIKIDANSLKQWQMACSWSLLPTTCSLLPTTCSAIYLVAWPFHYEVPIISFQDKRGRKFISSNIVDHSSLLSKTLGYARNGWWELDSINIWKLTGSHCYYITGLTVCLSHNKHMADSHSPFSCYDGSLKLPINQEESHYLIDQNCVKLLKFVSRINK